ncbi:MAG: RpiB/LacA/LacB family sugar-phosphate isomerase [Planctomycetaceae bacterium]|jgi:ribose 5-phosphate isomerase B|nr:RpiB/LacA/LacB family sugar-phosphate isomerase [Planctomycetaceae bacterium]
MNRRTFLQTAAVPVVLGSTLLAADSVPSTSKTKMSDKKIIVAADPFAIALKDAVVAHLKEKGYDVIDLGARKVDGNPKLAEIPYFESCPAACKAIQDGKASRGILFCGTGMGMSVIANRFKGIVASVVESVFAAKMCRSINNANVLCLGAMIWGDWMANEAVDTFLNTKFTEGLEPLADFLKDAEKKVEAIRDAK